jgi:hypothetical protein
MRQQDIKHKVEESIFVKKYKKWIAAGLGIYITPLVTILISIIFFATYSFFDSEIRWHPYVKYINGGYNVGLDDGDRDKKLADSTAPMGQFHETRYLDTIPWLNYKSETKKLKKQVIQEKDDYLAQFPEKERREKLVEMHANEIRLPLQLELDKRFDHPISFYTDYVAKKVKRENYKSDTDYQKALELEAWKVGYEYGYARGRAFGNKEKGMRW